MKRISPVHEVEKRLKTIFVGYVSTFQTFSRYVFASTFLKVNFFMCRIKPLVASQLFNGRFGHRQPSADEVLWMAKHLRRKCIKLSKIIVILTHALNRRSDRSFFLCVLGLLLSDFEKQACHSLRTCGRGTRLPGKIRKAKSLVIKCWQIQVFDSSFGGLFSMFKGTSPCQTQKLGRMTCQIQVDLSACSIPKCDGMCKGASMFIPFYSILMLEACGSKTSFMMNMKWMCKRVYQMSIILYHNEVFGDSTWMVKFAMNHRGLGPCGWRIISCVAGVLLVIPQWSAGDPNQQPTTDGSRYLKIYMIYILLDVKLGVRSFWKAEYHYKNHPFDSTCRIDGLWGWSLAVPWGPGRFRKTVDVVKRCDLIRSLTL